MTQNLTFYTNPMSRGRIVRWMLEEVGQPYETVILGYEDSMKAPDYLAVNPMGKVPAIKHGDTVVTEGAAICAYLADAFPDAGLAPPPGNQKRGTYYRWLFFGAGPVESVAIGKALGLLAPADKKRMAGYGSYEDVMNTLEQAVSNSGGPYLCGDQFTAADVYLGSQIGWGMQFGTIDKRPAFETYFARLVNRPAAVRAREIDDALTPPEMRPQMPAPQPA
ncbi:MAG TPA: glutathione S-transferase family protein [Allosphingosinicella sp.]|nr:glutathione S-transferase family protein [Allosphingosinicella sp.]